MTLEGLLKILLSFSVLCNWRANAHFFQDFLSFLGLNEFTNAIYFHTKYFSVSDLVDFTPSTGNWLSVPRIITTKCSIEHGQAILMPSDISSVSPAGVRLTVLFLVLRLPGNNYSSEQYEPIQAWTNFISLFQKIYL